MRHGAIPGIISLLLISSPLYAQRDLHAENNYLQNRSSELSRRIDRAVKNRQIAAKDGFTLLRSVRQVQLKAEKIQRRNGSIGRADTDKMNQNLTDVERILTRQP